MDDWYTEEQIEELMKEAAPASDLKKTREQEHQLLYAFKKSPSKETFMPLYTSFKPWIMKAAQRNMFGSPIPQAAHMAYAAQAFLDATRTYDPSKGTFHQHAFNTVSNKGKRLNLSYQNIGYIPESRATKYQAYQTAQYLLQEQLGREPSAIELADEMALPVTEVERLRKEVRQDLVMRDDHIMKGPAFAQSDKALQLARDIQYDLIPKHRVVLEHVTGINGITPLTRPSAAGPVADIHAIARATKLSVPEVRSAMKTISRKLSENLGRVGKQGEDEESSEIGVGG